MARRTSTSTDRVGVDLYRRVRRHLLKHDPDAPELLAWANTIRRPASPQDLALEIVWIILCAGRRAQAARTIEKRVLDALHEGRPVVDVFGHAGKAAAIERAWTERHSDWLELQAIRDDDVDGLLRWCAAIPYVGEVTKFQLAKNLGLPVCKPDIWLCRLAGIPDRPKPPVPVRDRLVACLSLCRTLAAETGDSVAAVDTLLWLACNKGLLHVSPAAGPVTFRPGRSTARSVLESAVS